MSTSDPQRRRALVVGGTGPTGPHVVRGLVQRGYDVAILHSGRHEDDSIPSTVAHIHTDAFDRKCLVAELGQREFEVAIVMYAGEDRLIEEWQRAVTRLAPLAAELRATGTLGNRYRPDFDAVSGLAPGSWALLSPGR